ncbi:MAG TPA: hypothetical protein VNL15_00775 [Dehalococcoidia bacterium]|nr:hypothetical protein [Dehalococcoidia bacterium]
MPMFSRQLPIFENAYRGKYGKGVDTVVFPVYGVRPEVAFGFISTPEQWAVISDN